MGATKQLLLVVEESAGAAIVGICGDATLPLTILEMGDADGVGIAAAELTPRLGISQEPSAIPARGFPPGVVGVVDVGLEDDPAMLLEPKPHIPDKLIDPAVVAVVIPEIGSDPGSVDIADVAGIPAEVTVVSALAAVPDIPAVPIVAALAIVADPSVNPPPS